MLRCPVCGSTEDYCEHADMEKGEVDRYYCEKCGYDSGKDKEKEK